VGRHAVPCASRGMVLLWIASLSVLDGGRVARDISHGTKTFHRPVAAIVADSPAPYKAGQL